ncbi:MAG: hypothetical protein HY392_01225 [Candidatus Diapherotrites archaeon]|nr:hypothetical protein [Candidatus Diapherotrites archaeon]
MAFGYSKALGLMAFLFFIAAFGLSANAGIYNYYFQTCCTGYYTGYYAVGVYNPQGDPSYFRYDPYAYEIDPYPTRSLPSYPYTYTYYPAYAYVGYQAYGYAGYPGYAGTGYSYSPYVYSEYTRPYSYPAYEVRFA